MKLMSANLLNPALAAITDKIEQRSAVTRASYLTRMAAQSTHSRARQRLAAANLAHGYAALPSGDKIAIMVPATPMIGIVSAYNDVLSAHQPLEHYPDLIRDEARKHGAIAQMAGGVPAMCDGVTQGQPGMDLSLFSRDVIAQSTAIALTHDLYDAAILLGVCDKIVPGLLIGALSFGHMPMIFVPAGPMSSGLSNEAKSSVRKSHARGEVGAEALLKSEMAAYHSAGTCTFYGTANSNQFLLEAMGLMLPGAAFIHPDAPERQTMTRAATARMAALAVSNTKQHPSAHGGQNLAQMVDAKAIINAIIALMATGGSTNHTMHWVSIARAAGIQITWDDFDELSRITPLLARVYPNGSADVNDMHLAGGTAYVLRELLNAGLLHDKVHTVTAKGISDYTQFIGPSKNESVLRPANQPFQADGGLRLLKGNLGRAVVKISAVSSKHRIVKAPAKVFDSQEAVLVAFKNKQLDQDCVIVVRGMGPRACGMPELHKLTPALTVLQEAGYQVALVTDGRMSGASGKVPAAIHLTPEAAMGGPIARIQDGDMLTVDCDAGALEVELTPPQLQARELAPIQEQTQGFGRELFGNFRAQVTGAEQGASVLN
jgi:phosphogluconate dehydratase